MKCIHCGSEWNVSPGLSMSISNCPFCGKSLIPEKKQLNTVEDVLVEINRLFGLSVLVDETKLVAYFSDLAPQLSRQRRILGYFIECGGPKKIVSVMSSSDDEQSVCIKQIVREMKDEMFIEEAASQMICESFLFAVSGQHSEKFRTENLDAMTAEAQYQKGEEHYNCGKLGGGDPNDYTKAFEWYQKAALRDHPMAQCRLGRMYREGHGVEKNEKQAFSWFMKAAQDDQNCPSGQFYVGACYYYGTGVAINYKEATRWYEKAALQNDILAQSNLGWCYEWGEGVEKDINAAIHWYQLAAEQGEPMAKCSMGRLYKQGKGVPRDVSKAFSLFKESAGLGDSYGAFLLGLCYLESSGTERDINRAHLLIRQAADMGLDVAQFELAKGYEDGRWGGKDAKQAFFWYEKAADQGYSLAMTCLGTCYENGRGVPQNDKYAVEWYEKAIQAGDQSGAIALQLIKLKQTMDPNTRKFVEAMANDSTLNSLVGVVTQVTHT